jgi:hypothetical protein
MSPGRTARNKDLPITYPAVKDGDLSVNSRSIHYTVDGEYSPVPFSVPDFRAR